MANEKAKTKKTPLTPEQKEARAKENREGLLAILLTTSKADAEMQKLILARQKGKLPKSFVEDKLEKGKVNKRFMEWLEENDRIGAERGVAGPSKALPWRWKAYKPEEKTTAYDALITLEKAWKAFNEKLAPELAAINRYSKTMTQKDGSQFAPEGVTFTSFFAKNHLPKNDQSK